MQPFETLEQKFGEWVGNGMHMVAVSSGTSALHLALEALDVGLGQEVVMSDYNMVACPRATAMAGLKPMFLDCNSRLLMEPNHLWNFLEDGDDGGYRRQVGALLATHIYGRRCSERLNDAAIGLDIPIVEDLSELHGVQPREGTDVACWSFYKNKIIAGEEGGMVGFRDSKHAEKARQLRSLGFNDRHNFYHIPRGVNARMSNVHAELILKSLYYVKENLEDRRQIEGWYNAHTPIGWQMPERNVVWVYDMRIPGMTEDQQLQVVKVLNEQGVAARHGFKPMHAQAEFIPQYHDKWQLFPNSRRLATEVIYLPVVPGMQEEDVVANCNALKTAVGNFA